MYGGFARFAKFPSLTLCAGEFVSEQYKYNHKNHEQCQTPYHTTDHTCNQEMTAETAKYMVSA